MKTIFREEDIIYNETLNQNVRKTEVANLIACATLSLWYDDAILWSREGFITFLAAHILDQVLLIFLLLVYYSFSLYNRNDQMLAAISSAKYMLSIQIHFSTYIYLLDHVVLLYRLAQLIA